MKKCTEHESSPLPIAIGAAITAVNNEAPTVGIPQPRIRHIIAVDSSARNSESPEIAATAQSSGTAAPVAVTDSESPLRTAAIDPRDTRRVLCHWIEDAWRTLPEQLGPRGRTMRK